MAKKPTNPASTTRTMAYDVAEQLRTPEEIAAYLDAWLAEAPDDAEGLARARRDIARAHSDIARAKGDECRPQAGHAQ